MEICEWKLGGYPEIKTFVEHKSARFPNLKVEYIQGAAPTLLLMSLDDQVKKTLAIGEWKEQAIVS